MIYFTPDFTKFLKDLEQNNSTEWFNQNRKVYEKQVKEPFARFVAEMIKQIQKHEPDVNIKPADAIARINKDVRFSKDKTPYNTHVAANISPFGKKDKSYPGFYFQLSHDKVMLYGGSYMVQPVQLSKIRNSIAGNIEAFSALYESKDFKEKFGTIQGEKNKRVPEEFQTVAAQEPLILGIIDKNSW
jgi:uncharacterized protein (TIGR02453 family)